MDEDKCSQEGEDEKPPESHLTASAEVPEVQTAAATPGTKDEGRTWWMTDVLVGSDKRSDHCTTSGSSRWDFRNISFPDLGSSDRLPSCLAPPDPYLLPVDVTVGVCDVAPWRRKINLRKVRMSAKEEKKEEEKRRRRRDVNKDREVCSSWKSYVRALYNMGHVMGNHILILKGSAVQKLGGVPGAPGKAAREAFGPTSTPLEPGSHSFT